MFWAIIKDENQILHFAYGPNFLSVSRSTLIGQQVTFTPLPPLPSSKFPRAIEVMVQRKIEHNSYSHQLKAIRPDLPGTE